MAYVLIIDPEATVRQVVSTILERSGYDVRSTGDFNEAVDVIRETHPDLVLTNIFLKDISGHDAMQQLKRKFPGIPVLMVTGLPDETVIREWMNQDGFDVFPKPFTRESLLSKIQQMLGNRSDSSASRASSTLKYTA